MDKTSKVRSKLYVQLLTANEYFFTILLAKFLQLVRRTLPAHVKFQLVSNFPSCAAPHKFSSSSKFDKVAAPRTLAAHSSSYSSSHQNLAASPQNLTRATARTQGATHSRHHATTLVRCRISALKSPHKKF